MGERSLTGAVSLLTLAVAFGAMFAGVPYWWAVFVIGYGFVLPAVAMLERGGDEETNASERSHAESASSTDDRGLYEESKHDALETLRERYATGELSEAQFEAKLERLLETETLEDARAHRSVDRNRRAHRPDDRSRGPRENDSTGDFREPEREQE